MKKTLFEREIQRAQAMKEVHHEQQFYWDGYRRGLRRRYHGSDFGTDEEHQLWLTASGDDTRNQRSAGYRDGYYGPVDWSDLPLAIATLQKWRGWSVADLAEALSGEPCPTCGHIAEWSPRTIEGWKQGRAIPDEAITALKRIHTSD